jgi:hypothetical protein
MKVFRRTAGDTLNVHRRNKEILEEVKVEPVDDKLRRHKSNWLRYETIMNISKMPTVMLNCKPQG